MADESSGQSSGQNASDAPQRGNGPALPADVAAQVQRLSESVTAGVDAATARRAYEGVKDAQLAQQFINLRELADIIRETSGQQDNLFYAWLDEDATREYVEEVVKEWRKAQDMQRVADEMGIECSPAELVIKRQLAIRFEKTVDKWRLYQEGIGSVGQKHSVVIIIALSEELNHQNGCCVKLTRGQCVVIRGQTPIHFPMPGGGVAIFIEMEKMAPQTLQKPHHPCPA